MARAVARHLAPGTTTIVQFHPSYSYEDFFEGFRPTPLEDGGVGFTLTPGPLRQMASDAAQDPTTPYVLLIDEINRGNIAKIFGELYFLLEYRTEHVRLQYSPDDQFTLPENLFIIGTMNTADRSIALVDAAIRRRFAFVEMDPSAPPVQGLLGRWLRAQDEGPLRADLLEALNAKLAPLDPDLRVGPSYLMRPEAATEAGLADIWRYDILPLLEEQLYDRLSPAEIRSAFGLATLLRPLTSAGAPTTAHEGVAAPDMSGDGRSGTEAPAES
ncbi:MAG: AAA family ATPase [Propionibacterium sp.]|nr:AAA family ATPase [Propionibacterium sp.]